MAGELPHLRDAALTDGAEPGHQGVADERGGRPGSLRPDPRPPGGQHPHGPVPDRPPRHGQRRRHKHGGQGTVDEDHDHAGQGPEPERRAHGGPPAGPRRRARDRDRPATGARRPCPRRRPPPPARARATRRRRWPPRPPRGRAGGGRRRTGGSKPGLVALDGRRAAAPMGGLRPRPRGRGGGTSSTAASADPWSPAADQVAPEAERRAAGARTGRGGTALAHRPVRRGPSVLASVRAAPPGLPVTRRGCGGLGCPRGAGPAHEALEHGVGPQRAFVVAAGTGATAPARRVSRRAAPRGACARPARSRSRALSSWRCGSWSRFQASCRCRWVRGPCAARPALAVSGSVRASVGRYGDARRRHRPRPVERGERPGRRGGRRLNSSSGAAVTAGSTSPTELIPSRPPDPRPARHVATRVCPTVRAPAGRVPMSCPWRPCPPREVRARHTGRRGRQAAPEGAVPAVVTGAASMTG